jgi:hypothetical protein
MKERMTTGKSVPESSETTNETERKSGSIVGGFRGRLQKHKQKKVLFIAGAVVLLLVGLTTYGLYRQFNPSVTPASFEDQTIVSADFSTLDREDIPAALEAVTGVTVEDLQKKKIDRKLLPTFGKAYAAAQALDVLGDRKHAAQAYAVAEDQLAAAKIPGTGEVDFHLEYAVVAYRLNDRTLASRQLQLASEALDHSKASEDQINDARSRIDLTKKWGTQ